MHILLFTMGHWYNYFYHLSWWKKKVGMFSLMLHMSEILPRLEDLDTANHRTQNHCWLQFSSSSSLQESSMFVAAFTLFHQRQPVLAAHLPCISSLYNWLISWKLYSLILGAASFIWIDKYIRNYYYFFSVTAFLGTEELTKGTEWRNRGQAHFLGGASDPQRALKSVLEPS